MKKISFILKIWKIHSLQANLQPKRSEGRFENDSTPDFLRQKRFAFKMNFAFF